MSRGTVIGIPVTFNRITFAYEAKCKGCNETVYFLAGEVSGNDYYSIPLVVQHYDCEFLKNGE